MAQVKGTMGVGGGTTSASKSLATLGKNLVTTVNKGITSLAGASKGAASTANAISNSAQNAQATFNQSSIDQANALTQANFEKQMEYNSAEAEKNRKWQEEMASTAYQRTVADMIKAGINPILASQLGATTVGSGATASVGAPSGQGASIGNYTGQMENMSTELAMFGAIASAFGEALSGLTQMKTDFGININLPEIGETFIDAMKDMAEYDPSNPESYKYTAPHLSEAMKKYLANIK